MSDLISRQDAIDALNACSVWEVTDYANDIPFITVARIDKDDAIQALQEIPSVQPESCEDAVSRSNLRLMKTEECAGHTIEYAMGWKACIEWIKTLPSVQPERKTGRWKMQSIKGNTLIYCSECGFGKHINEMRRYSYCPNCGAEMKGDSNG